MTQKVLHSTYSIERRYAASAEKVFGALSDPGKKRRWFAEGESSRVEEFQMDFRVGGRERTRFRSPEDSPLKGAPLTNETVFQDIETGRRVVLAYTMAVGDRRISASLATFELLPVEGGGTDLIFTEQAAFFEGSDGPKIREQGWQELLKRLETVL
jgi:uncharacterized protein YndB with AHSA1/START domain